jgi:hypothetical protein
VDSPSGEGTLIVFFGADGSVGSPAQVPVAVLFQIGRRICELCVASSESGGALPGAGRSTCFGPDTVLDPREFRAALHQEWLRSRRYGHAFALIRLSPVDPAAADTLRAFLVSEKREVDLLAEAAPGVFLILSPEVDRQPEGMRGRLLRRWLALHPDSWVTVNQRVYPRDGQDESFFQAWSGGPAASRDAA